MKHYIIQAIISSLFLFFEGVVQRNLFVFAYHFKFNMFEEVDRPG